MKNKVVVISGPTASGKSKLAVDIATKTNGVVVNCDSMQIYKGIPVISAAPSAEEYAKAEHRLFEIYDCNFRGNVVDWTRLCANTIEEIWNEQKIPVVVGGTGMYVDSLLNGVSPIPATPPQVREKVNFLLQTRGLEYLYSELQKFDAVSANKLAPKDKTRIMRATEVFYATGKTISEWHKLPQIKILPEADFLVVKVFPELAEIEQRCCSRLDTMVTKSGALNEIKRLIEQNISEEMPAMKALGVPELGRYIKGEITLQQALDLAKLHTRQYAKRQRTWLKHRLHADIELFDVYRGQPEFVAQILNAINL